MKSLAIMILASAFPLAPVLAQNSMDKMEKGGAMQKDRMGKDRMAKDKMSKDKMSKDKMAKDKMAK
ncbi:MAG TPA: pentapeptide MXKDX repeat protein [Burkholderiales bacterium]|nr:pentapeptide MXKDX repeat protein [Burkholderiales bacterium]